MWPNDAAAILVSDIHFDHTPPIAFKGHWYDHMYKVCQELRKLQKQCGNVPIIVAGDIFHKPNQPPQLINFLIANMPEVWAIPGQHDMPYHRYDELHKSAFATLNGAGKLALLAPIEPKTTGRNLIPNSPICAHAVPWGFPLQPCNRDGIQKGLIHLLVCHRYIWSGNARHPGAKKGDDIHSKESDLSKTIDSYDAAVFGDNHRHFFNTSMNLLNCGCLIRRKRDEVKYTPMFGVLHLNGKITPHKFPELGETFLEKEALIEAFLGKIDVTVARDLDRISLVMEDFVKALKTAVVKWSTSEDKIRAYEMLMEILEDV